MEVINNPDLTHLHIGSALKVLKINATAGMGMPLHHSTKEGVIIVQQGEARLKSKNNIFFLQKGSSFLIPAGLEHSLTILKDFKAVVVMAIDSNINFKN
ncbi:cupin [Arenibacter sp. 6A1]|uniref:cupin domain-containing protein n=1 Tax=Arenibacter sp. 6A1 TaxID=2720391 RepID=UPI001445A962|nr:cupin domain-containing protein [Arenibacter sp. 6A1]NKI27051.1 cupin [Arenibacter sp. 6A1]